jgi:FkbM family methyltransferase
MIAHDAARWCLRSIRRAAPRLRGQARLARHLTRALARLGPVSIDAYGCQFELDLRDHVEALIFWETYEDAVLALWRSSVGADSVVFDVGANVGLYSLVAAAKGARVFAFEPNPPTRKRLARNLALNRTGARVTVDAHALSDAEGTAMLFDDVNANGGAHNFGVASLSNVNAGGSGKPVETTTIDSVVAAHNLSRLDWIKMDIQGAELLALRGARSTLQRLKPDIMMEFDGEGARNMGWGRGDLDEFLARVGYGVQPFDGLNFLARPLRRSG